MSDEAPKPPKPTAKTSTVPLKKETVRISLRAKPGAGITQPKEETAQTPTAKGPEPGSSVTKPPVAKPTISTAPVPPPPSASGVAKPPAPATAVPAPPSAASAPPLKPAATVPLRTAAAAPSAELKKTQKVTVKAVPSTPPGAEPAKTVPLATAQPSAGGGTQALPKATVKLQKPGETGVATAGQPSGALGTTDLALLEDDDSESGMLPFSIAVAVLGLAALVVSMMASDIVGIGVPEQKKVPWEKNTGTGWTSTFDVTHLPEVPVYK